jgi:Sugar (and other) transporter
MGIRLLPESPRYCFATAKFEKAKEVLTQVRGDYTEAVEDEYLEICALAADTKPASPLQFAKVLLGRCKGKARRTLAGMLGFACGFGLLDWYHCCYGILSRNSYSSWLRHNPLNTIGIVGTIISAHIVDRLGRRKYLMGGAAGLFGVNLIAASLYESTIHGPAKAAAVASAAMTMLFLFNLSVSGGRFSSTLICLVASRSRHIFSLLH